MCNYVYTIDYTKLTNNLDNRHMAYIVTRFVVSHIEQPTWTSRGILVLQAIAV